MTTQLPPNVSLTVAKLDRSRDVSGLVHSTETPGGYKECRFSVDSKIGPTIDWDDPVIIYDSLNQRYPFVGIVSDIHKTGLCFDITAVRGTRLRVIKSTTGPGNLDHPSGVYAGRIYQAGTPIIQALQDALQLCETVFEGNIDPALEEIQFAANSDNIAGYTAEQIWNYIASILSGFETPMQWHIRAAPGGLQVVYIDFQDPSARYLTSIPEEDIEEDYDAEQVITTAAVEWGNDQVYQADLASVTSAGRKLAHDKYVNASREITRLGDAQGIAGLYTTMFGQFRSTSGQITMRCDRDTVQVKPPVASSDNWPLWLIETGHGCQLLKRPLTLAPYNESLKYIVGTEYTWDTGVLVCRTGIAVGGLDSRILKTTDYNVNRMFFGPYNGPPGANAALADSDLLPQVGPEVSGTATSYAIPAFKEAISPDDPNVPHKKQLDPNIVPDEGLEANINFDPATSGFQAAIRTTPGTYVEYRLLLGDADGLVGDIVVAELYRVIPPSESPLGGTQFLCTIQSGGLEDRTLPLNTPAVLKRGDYAMIKVTTPGTVATWAAVSLHAKKNFPRLKS